MLSMKILDKILGRFAWYRDWRGGTWYGGGVLVKNGKTSKVPWERLSGNVDPSSIAVILRRKYFN